MERSPNLARVLILEGKVPESRISLVLPFSVIGREQNRSIRTMQNAWSLRSITLTADYLQNILIHLFKPKLKIAAHHMGNVEKRPKQIRCRSGEPL